ncbi:MAG TPA: class I SAM-dependent RNA methyltransferase [Sphingomicrobium sp.]|nr:class I SAM-dependent RNA methyltransferase [Sphingomicrobium sp.]
MNEPIIRIAARGDGVTASGRHVPFGVPGDALLDDGALAFGPHHQEPPCRHFPECGGCQLQHADDEAFRLYLISRIETALAQHGLKTEIRPPHLSPPNSRRRATLKSVKVGQSALLGFNAEMSHRIVDMRECHILHRELFELVDPLRELLANLLTPRRAAEIQLTLINRGVDVLLKGIFAGRLTEIEQLTSFAIKHDLARLSVDRALGPEALFEPQPASVTLSGVPVGFPPGTFLQATEDGETELIYCVQEVVGGFRNIADLFSGLGTFALATSASYAAEASRDVSAALKRAAPAVSIDHRDLYRRPLEPSELKRFDAVILDPPRAGAAEQVAQLAKAKIARVAYVSCNPATFARDAKTLVEGGYVLGWVKPVGQFRWSTHVELAACFTHGG